MGARRRHYYYYTNKEPNADGMFPLSEEKLAHLAPGDGLWLVGKEAIFYSVEEILDGSVRLERKDAEGVEDFGNMEFGALSETDGYQLPATRQVSALIPTGKPLAMEVEHKGDGSGPGEMVIELYSKDGDGYIKRSTDDDLDALMAEAFETLLRLQLKTLESTAEIGELWIKYLKYKQGGR
ncbi:hypothetical protein PEPNEM18_00784 [Aedoeadaptatus nemausensis]|uniref:Uncharacterized protein n=1 Tax=Aedoeadaptatus nemausensis TaxID=2582829 RepID=A0A6V6Y253_9FIRM|nr:hypothetical protein [Peptoniphilus nemausensis]CAC9928771.1 hypothetical protein PEPNEM18_00784 [Peptoniphilus nemausensis]